MIKEPGFKHRAIAWLIASFIRLLALTLRIKLTDHAGITRKDGTLGPVIWASWHNRILLLPYVRCRYCRHRHGAVLTSASDDGAILAATMSEFGVSAVRGSSSRGGMRAMRSLARWVGGGYDVMITPDGPRGPRYHLNPGIVHLARSCGVPILPIAVEYSWCIRLRSWDGFMVPVPFSRVEVCFEKPVSPGSGDDDGGFELERERLESRLRALAVLK